MKRKWILLVLALALMLTGCGLLDSGDDPDEGEELPDDPVIEEPEEREEVGRVFLEESPDKITIYSKDIEISRLDLVSLSYDEDKDELVEGDILKSKVDIAAGEKVLWDVVYGEGVPSMKLNWEIESGQTGDYIIAYNGRYGRNPDKTIIYYDNGDIEEELEEMVEVEDEIEYKKIKLYFPVIDEMDSYLIVEEHEIEKVSAIARKTLETLRDTQPNNEWGVSPIYETTSINRMYVKDGIMHVDFSEDIGKMNKGSTLEMLSLQSIVNTLTQFPTVDGVVFTIEGDEDIESWLSHIGNMGEPFREDLSMLR